MLIEALERPQLTDWIETPTGQTATPSPEVDRTWIPLALGTTLMFAVTSQSFVAYFRHNSGTYSRVEYSFGCAADVDEQRAMATPQQMISGIKAAFSMTVTDIAQAAGVERPTIYAWLGGASEPQATNLKRLHRLFLFAKRWEEISGKPLAKVVRLPDGSGRSLLDCLKDSSISSQEIEQRLTLLAAAIRDGLAQGVQSRPIIKNAVAEAPDSLTGARGGPEA